MWTFVYLFTCCLQLVMSRDEENIMKSCYWPNEIYDACFGGCAEVSCDNPRNHLRPCYPYCEPGCICEEPYVRDDRTHQCVLPQDCSPTQLGIPLPVKKSNKQSTAYMDKPYVQFDKPSTQYVDKPSMQYAEKLSHHQQREENEFRDHEGSGPLPTNHLDDGKKDVSRTGNYFNIVIAPPPIKSVQPRKLVQSETYGKRAY